MILRLFVLIGCVVAVGGAFLLRHRADTNTGKLNIETAGLDNVDTNPRKMDIETVGLDKLGIRVEAPYGQASPMHALIVNNSSHTIIACDVVFEYTKDDGTLFPAYKTVIFGSVVSVPPPKRPALLKNNPCIPPHSKMLLGLGREPDMVLITNRLPELGNSAVEVTRNPKVSFPKVTIRLSAVMFEDGNVAGPTGEEFRKKVNEALSEDKKQ